MFRIICLLIGYAFGCIQTAYLVGKFAAHIDIREHGSGNAGTTNVLRTMGFSAGIIVFAIDCLKTIAAYATASLIFNGGGSFFGVSYVLPGLYAGLGAVLGHNFPFFMKLKGGKGIAATGGLILALDWRAGLLSLVVFLLSSVLTRRISVGSLLMTLLAPFMFAFLGYSREVIAVAAVLTAMAWTMHRGNIKRLLNGTEPATSFSKKTKV